MDGGILNARMQSRKALGRYRVLGVDWGFDYHPRVVGRTTGWRAVLGFLPGYLGRLKATKPVAVFVFFFAVAAAFGFALSVALIPLLIYGVLGALVALQFMVAYEDRGYVTGAAAISRLLSEVLPELDDAHLEVSLGAASRDGTSPYHVYMVWYNRVLDLLHSYAPQYVRAFQDQRTFPTQPGRGDAHQYTMALRADCRFLSEVVKDLRKEAAAG